MISIIAFLIILAILILLFSVRIFVDLELTDELRLNLWVFGIRIRLLPKKEKKYKLSDYTPKKIAKREAKRKKLEAKRAQKLAKKRARKAAEAKLTRAQRRELKRQRRQSRPALTDSIGLATKVVKLFFSTFFSHLHIKTSRLRIKVGGPDAAQIALRWYGIYAACGALISLLDKYSNLHGQSHADIDISPDYLSEKIEADLKLSFSMNLWGMLCVAVKVAVASILGWMDIQPKGSSVHKVNAPPSKSAQTTKKA